MKTNIEALLFFLLIYFSSPLYSQTGPWGRYNAKMKNDALVRESDAGNLEEVKRIINGGADVNVQLEQTKLTPLVTAASGAKLEVIRYLLSLGADPAVRDWQGYTALDRAKWTGNTEVIKVLNEAMGNKTEKA